MTLTKSEQLEIIDGVCLICYAILFMYQILIITKYLVPLKIRDRYIIAFYLVLTVCLTTMMMEIIARLINNDPAFMITRT